MSGFVRATAVGVVVLAGVLVVIVEAVCWAQGSEWRRPLYSAAAMGFALNILSYPIMLKLASMPAAAVKEGGALNWWMLGMLARMSGLGILMYVARGKFPGRENATAFTTIAVYMAGMLAELVWLTKRLNAMDKK